MATYPHCTREELDEHYFIRGRVPEWDEKMQLFEALSKNARAEKNCRTDIGYGPGARQTFDRFSATDTGPRGPILIFVHGGYWRMMDKGQFSYLAGAFQPFGITLVNVNYGLLPDSSLAEMVQDVRMAINTVHHSHLEQFGTAPKIFLSGHSAGAQLAGFAACHAAVGRDGPDIAGFVGVSGVYDLEPVRASFLNDIGFLDEQSATEFGAPAIRPQGACRASIFVGGEEGAEFERQSRQQSEIWSETGNIADYDVLPGLNHATILESLGDPSSRLTRAMRALITQGE